MLVRVVNRGIVFGVPPVVVTVEGDGGATVFELPGSLGALGAAVLPPDGAANTKAEAGSPPRVCASAAFIA